MTDGDNLDNLLNYPFTICLYNGWAATLNNITHQIISYPFIDSFGFIFISNITNMGLAWDNINNRFYTSYWENNIMKWKN